MVRTKRRVTAWQAHVKKTMAKNKGKKFGDVLRLAKKTYRR